MWTPEKIEQFCLNYGFKPRNTKTEIKALPEMLNSEEQLLGLLEGFLESIFGKKGTNGKGLIIATNKRIIFFRKSIIGTTTKEEIPLAMVISASYRKGLIVASIVISTANNDSTITYCEPKLAEKFSKLVTQLVHNSHNQTLTNNNQNDSAQQLEKLFDLKQKGILTEEEFNQQKAKILAK